jgi:hypothetical protein
MNKELGEGTLPKLHDRSALARQLGGLEMALHACGSNSESRHLFAHTVVAGDRGCVQPAACR